MIRIIRFSFWLAAMGVVCTNAVGSESVVIAADEWKPMNVLADFLKTVGGYEVRCSEQAKLESDLSSYKAVFMYIHGKLEDKTESALIGYARKGGRLIILHHGLASARMNNPEWLRFTGIHLNRRDDSIAPWRVIGDATFTLVNLQPNHYITSHNVHYDRQAEYLSSDVPSVSAWFPALDLPGTEVFLNQHFSDGREKTVLFGFLCSDPKTEEIYRQDRAGWYKPAGAGWIFYLQPGHAERDFQNRNYCQIILNCLTWNPCATTSR